MLAEGDTGLLGRGADFEALFFPQPDLRMAVESAEERADFFAGNGIDSRERAGDLFERGEKTEVVFAGSEALLEIAHSGFPRKKLGAVKGAGLEDDAEQPAGERVAELEVGAESRMQ